ncbi:hypothetical protein RIF29_15998 [Crotalaria pallida]|uniref:Uncharacterized protein n=1 Tax=Crotalaria pallida TaxID=3830 RepID=A0AAN9ID41_CROPI
MLEHEAIFKNQVYELHRLYRIQRDLMNEVKRKELHRNHIPAEASFSTDRLASQRTIEDGKRWHISGFPVGNSTSAKTSVSGVEGIHSPLDSMKGISKQGDLFSSPNGCSSKDVEVLESRPSKVRRKMFDLQLPADAYIDTEESEKLSDEKTNGPTLFLPDRNCKNGRENDANFFVGNGVKTSSQEDTSRSEQFSSRRNGLADLNEPVQVEETTDTPYVHLPSHNPYQGATECSNASDATKQQPRFFGLSSEHLLNSHCGTDSWARKNGYLENNGSGKGWIASAAEAGQVKSKVQPVSQALKLETSLLSSQTMQDALSKAHEPAFDYLTSRSKADLQREKTVIDLDFGERCREYSANKHPESVLPLHRPGHFTVSPSIDLYKSWSHSASSWEMANSSLSQKLTSVQMPSCLNASGALSRSSQSHKSNGILEDSWPLNINSKPNSGFRCDVPMQNGFHAMSLSRSKEPSTSYVHLNHNIGRKVIPEHSINNGSNKGSNSNFNDMKSRNIDLNVLLSNGSSNNLISQSGIVTMDGEHKYEEYDGVLPWLRAKTTCRNVAKNGDSGISAGESSFFHVASLSKKDETEKGPCGNFMHNVISVSCSNDNEPKRTEASESSSSKKILGVPIFDMPHISPKKELSSITSPPMSVPSPPDVEVVENNRKNRLLDINLPCDDAVLDLDKEAVAEIVVCKEKSPTKEANSRNLFDLNLCMSEDEASLTTIPSDNVKMKAAIDLEAPAVPENEEDSIPEEKLVENSPESPKGPLDTVEQTHDELTRHAAEAIVVLSSLPCDQVDGVIGNPSESTTADPLSWFVDVISSCEDNLESKLDNSREKSGVGNEESPSFEGMDCFEAMTLQLPETKEEDYMPKPFVPENFIVEETITSLPTRTRRGAARRGRQRRDFQRDILPGLASLSRHEVTEDLQTFGGLMRATGHSWHSGSTRRSSSRNGSVRGRRRAMVAPSPPPVVATNETCTPLMQHLNNIEVGLEDRSLTGWGKTTRRPRRQRCPAGNPPSIPLT